MRTEIAITRARINIRCKCKDLQIGCQYPDNGCFPLANVARASSSRLIGRQEFNLPINTRSLTFNLQYYNHIGGLFHFSCISPSVCSYGSCDGPGLCGYDLHDDEGVAWGQEGKYSTVLFTQRARKILESHDPTDKPLFLLLSLQVSRWRLTSEKYV